MYLKHRNLFLDLSEKMNVN
uniref:Uncharacterized protein n=1 Tax=Anguilla anguilla TaxID=7936 RepID=A0A0E9RDZ5_ANGAN